MNGERSWSVADLRSVRDAWASHVEGSPGTPVVWVRMTPGAAVALCEQQGMTTLDAIVEMEPPHSDPLEVPHG